MSDGGVYVILGGTGGIGSAVARRLVERQASVVVAARDEAKLSRCAEELGVETISLDATRFEEVERCVNEAVKRHGRLDGIANCVGSILLKPAHMTSEEEWLETVALNLTSAFATVRAAARPLMKQGGSIVLVSTAAARLGFPNHEAIAATKAGVIGLTLSAAASYAPKEVRVNCVAPGLTRTPLAEKITSNEPALKASTAMHALGRIGEPNDVAAAIDWLLDPSQSWVTGQVLGVDGGLGTVRSRG
jgi:NAD(P)-dependent dehydrogenase (short-subunit alcohol dehydrogenase family)